MAEKRRRRYALRPLAVSLLAALAVGALGARPAIAAAQEASAAVKKTSPVRWRIRGDLTEACTCSVPCSCNFGQGPSPHHYCWAVFSYGIRKGHYGNVKLDGLRLAGAVGEKGFIWYLDERATPEQAAALRAIADHIASTMEPDPAAPDATPLNFLGFKTAPIEQVTGERSARLMIGGRGGFEADYLIGLDGKTPIKVVNNWSWNVTDCIKGKTRRFKYEDDFGNRIDVEGVNANQGKFDYTEKTKVFIR